MQKSGDGQTVPRAIQGHFCDNIVNVAHAKQANGQPAHCIALCATREGYSVFEVVGKESDSGIKLSGGVLCVLDMVSRGALVAEEMYVEVFVWDSEDLPVWSHIHQWRELFPSQVSTPALILFAILTVSQPALTRITMSASLSHKPWQC